MFKIAVGVAGSILNLLEIASLLHERRTALPFDITLISLATADLSFSLVLFIGSSIQLIYGTVYIIDVIVFCDIIFTGLSSVFHLVFIAVQRLIAVIRPLSFSVWFTKRRCVSIVFLLWLSSAIGAVPVAFNQLVYVRVLNNIHFPVGCILSLSYAILCYRILTRKRIGTTRNSSHQSKEIILYSFAVSIVYIACTWPVTICVIFKSETTFGTNLYILNAVFDPLVYCLFKQIKLGRLSLNCKRALVNADRKKGQPIAGRDVDEK